MDRKIRVNKPQQTDWSLIATGSAGSLLLQGSVGCTFC